MHSHPDSYSYQCECSLNVVAEVSISAAGCRLLWTGLNECAGFKQLLRQNPMKTMYEYTKNGVRTAFVHMLPESTKYLILVIRYNSLSSARSTYHLLSVR